MFNAKNTSYLLLSMGIIALAGVLGCSPATEAPGPGPEVDADPTATVETVGKGEGSEPKNANLPFGGVKNSGFGREGGHYSIDEMTQPKWITIKQGQMQYPF